MEVIEGYLKRYAKDFKNHKLGTLHFEADLAEKLANVVSVIFDPEVRS